MNESSLALIADYRPGRVFAWRHGTAVSAGCALAAMHAVAAQLPAGGSCINLCEDRYLFTVALAAGALANTLSLLPSSRAAGALEQVQAAYPQSVLIEDTDVTAWCSQARSQASGEPPQIPAEQSLAVVFTSGSTGTPNPHLKRWGDLATGSALMRARFFAEDGPLNIVATVPPQHMYGLETSVLPALHTGFAATADRVFMPWSVAGALAQLPEPRALVTTPVHLRACLTAGVTMPALRRIISATAPLDVRLAAEVETAWQAPVHEIYGSSETGSIASRRTTAGDIWQLYDGVRLVRADGMHVQGGHLPTPVPISDELSLLDAAHFRLLGRAADMLKVGGKRSSLAELTAELQAIDGVSDGIVFMPPDAPTRERPVALVVSDRLTPREIAAQLSRRVDPVFVPRPLLAVARLPRNDLGKLPRSAVAQAWSEARRASAGKITP